MSKPVISVIAAMSSLLVVLVVVIAMNAPREEPGATVLGAATEPTATSTTTTTTTMTAATITTTVVPVPTTTTPWTPPPPADGADVGACADLSCDVTVARGAEIPLARPASQHGPAYTQLYRVAVLDYEGRSITLQSLSRLDGQPIFTVDLSPGQYTELPDYTIAFVAFVSPGIANVKVCRTSAVDPRFGGGGCA
ncbi:hypothetical protein [Actinophytocola algeriensis]|uniref:Asparagine N-glycosylation enzyme membrane subunit Stt3 n=1 Tax=Actinophytocola algeriensis TaxID=1768010 RepID=A0A7W7Q8Q5_9PSEU|nr:hypothetical protein [Actinophytocola algeriensis]MBB4909037.1 asparagine N-glycosylation enzyme membrane subunit Stt3 [Actinophytocola algeriensis]MBE1474575.1 asparagine N-glycosylation enzyme membrane subunit Stt3 [Actinophytocola algeriensis]